MHAERTFLSLWVWLDFKNYGGDSIGVHVIERVSYPLKQEIKGRDGWRKRSSSWCVWLEDRMKSLKAKARYPASGPPLLEPAWLLTSSSTMPTSWIRVMFLKILKVFFTVPSSSSTSPGTTEPNRWKWKQLHEFIWKRLRAHTSNCKRDWSLS